MPLEQFITALDNYIGSEDFASLNDNDRQSGMEYLRKTFIADNPDVNPDDVNEIAEGRNKRYLRGTGRGRAAPNLITYQLPNQTPGYRDMTVDERATALQDFRAKIPEIAKQNPLQRDDTAFFLGQQIDQLERINNGEDSGYIHDKASRLGQGLIAGLMDSVGAESAAEAARGFFHENPKYDQDFGASLAEGIGSVGAFIAVIATAIIALIFCGKFLRRPLNWTGGR